jgi:hypothetical protein
MVFGLTTGVLATTLGPEWLPRDMNGEKGGERQTVTVPLEIYFRSKEMPDLPPGVVLLLALAMYGAPRLRAPDTSSKLKRVFLWVRSRFKKSKPAYAVRTPEKKVEPTAPPSTPGQAQPLEETEPTGPEIRHNAAA